MTTYYFEHDMRLVTKVASGQPLHDYQWHRLQVPRPILALMITDINFYATRQMIRNQPVVAAQVVANTTMWSAPRPRTASTWEYTVYQHIWDTLNDFDLSRWFLGLLVKETLIKRHDDWVSYGWEQPGRDYDTRIYFPLSAQANWHSPR